MWLDKYIRETGILTDYPCFQQAEGGESTCRTIRTNDLFLAQYYNGEYNGLDIVVKYLAVENYYNKNDFGFVLYKKMQIKRVGEDWTERFKQLILSFESGMDLQSWVKTDLDYSVHDGAHRLALALYHDIKSVPVKIFNLRQQRRYYGVDWFKDNGFSEEEIVIILKKYDEIMKKCNLPYYCILWPPAECCISDIISDISHFSKDVEYMGNVVYALNGDELQKFIYDVYATDDIAKYKLDLKYQHLINSMRCGGWQFGSCNVLVVQLMILHPDFRLKPLTGLPQSKVTMTMKKFIRDKYQNRIRDYYYDIIMHITDNQIQNDGVEDVLKKFVNRQRGDVHHV